MNTSTNAVKIINRIDALAQISEHESNLTRVSLSPEHQRANALVGSWMEDTGMRVRTDAIGNIIGRLEGTSGGPAMLLGSHLDTVRDGGRFDGMLGVVVPLVCIEALQARGERLAFPVEIVGFCDEEGVRFPSTLLGSRAIAGTLDETVLQESDQHGISMADALRNFGQNPADLHSARRSSDDFLGFVEMHIEQGPVLETEGLPVGVVTAISGAARYRITVTGKAGHAGTVPMGMRQDALAGASECIVDIERICKELADVVGTVGQIRAAPGAGNVIAGEVEFSLDLRSSVDATRQSAEQQILQSLEDIGTRRSLNIDPERTYQAASVTCDSWLSGQLAGAIKHSGHRLLCLPSGAGHDAMALANLTRIAMLFVRCKDGVSHHPDESITPEDAGAACEVLINFLTNFDPTA